MIKVEVLPAKIINFVNGVKREEIRRKDCAGQRMTPIFIFAQYFLQRV